MVIEAAGGGDFEAAALVGRDVMVAKLFFSGFMRLMSPVVHLLVVLILFVVLFMILYCTVDSMVCYYVF